MYICKDPHRFVGIQQKCFDDHLKRENKKEMIREDNEQQRWTEANLHKKTVAVNDKAKIFTTALL